MTSVVVERESMSPAALPRNWLRRSSIDMASSDPEAFGDVVVNDEGVVVEGVVVSDSDSAVVVSATVESCLFSIFLMIEAASTSSESISTCLL